MMVLKPTAWNRYLILFTIFKCRDEMKEHYSELKEFRIGLFLKANLCALIMETLGTGTFLYFLSNLSGIEQTTSSM